MEPGIAVDRDRPLWEPWISSWLLVGFRAGQYQGDALGDKLERRPDNNLGSG